MNYYPHHIGDYAKDTGHLSMLEDCAYRRMMDVYYGREQLLPPEREKVYRLVRVRSATERKAVDTILNEFFQLEADGWRNKRCDEEIDKANKKADAARENGKKGGRPNKPIDNPMGFQNGTKPETHRKAPNNQEPITNNQEPNKKNGADAPLPDWLPPEWKEFEQHRKEKRQGFTPTARKACIKKLGEWRQHGHDIARILRRSIDNGYTGLFEPSDNGSGKSGGNQAAIAQAERELFGEEKDITDESKRI